MYSNKSSVKPSTPALQSTRILDQLRERIRYMHYRLSTEQVYVYWVRFLIRWSGNGSAMRHPRQHPFDGGYAPSHQRCGL
jgi:uncharacterized protein YfbU (UPF0304 family)